MWRATAKSPSRGWTSRDNGSLDLARGPTGELYAVWTEYEGGGEHFASASRVPDISSPALGVNGSQQGGLMKKLAVNEAGVIAVVNSTFRANAESGVWLIQ